MFFGSFMIDSGTVKRKSLPPSSTPRLSRSQNVPTCIGSKKEKDIKMISDSKQHSHTTRSILPSEPRHIKVQRVGNGAEKEDTISVGEFVRTRVPSLLNAFSPTWWLSKCVSWSCLSITVFFVNPRAAVIYKHSGALPAIFPMLIMLGILERCWSCQMAE